MKNKFTIDLRGFLVLLLLLGAISGVGGSYYFYSKYQAVVQSPDQETQKETEALISALGELMELPTDETPSIAIISNKEKLQDQPFFQSVENGDVLFAYTNAMKAILYRPQTNKIIEVSPINFPDDEVQADTDI